VHRSITFVDFQLDEQNSYLFTSNIFIKILYIFRALLCLSSGGICRNSFLTAAQGSHLQKMAIPESAYIQLQRRSPEDEQRTARNM